MSALAEIAQIYSLLGQDQSKDVLDFIPIPIYFKNVNGVYLWRNRCAVEVMNEQGFEEGDNRGKIIGKTDFDIFEKNMAQEFHRNDQKVIHEDLAVLMPMTENIIFPNGVLGENISVKRVMRNSNGDIAGIVGCSVSIGIHSEDAYVEKNNSKNERLKNLVIRFMKSGDLLLLAEIYSWLSKIKPNKNDPTYLKSLYSLSQRELEVFFVTLKGHSNKSAGKILNISNRTVESYLATIKHKLGLSNKTEVYDFMWDILGPLA